jgi:hypothetical protein
MAGWADAKKRGRSWLIAAALVAAGVLVGQGLPRNNAATAAEKGTMTSVTPSADRTGADFVFQVNGSSQTLALGDRTPWQDKPGVWHHSGLPSCMLARSTAPRHITVGIIDVQATGTLPGGPLVVWVKCEG